MCSGMGWLCRDGPNGGTINPSVMAGDVLNGESSNKGLNFLVHDGTSVLITSSDNPSTDMSNGSGVLPASGSDGELGVVDGGGDTHLGSDGSRGD
jgi:hypothetical protein